MREYYRRSYARMRGYHYPKHFMEIPYWIPILSSMLPPNRFLRELQVVENIEEAEARFRDANDDTVFAMSVLDANLPFVRQLAATGARLILGGYTDPSQFVGNDRVRYLSEPGELVPLLEGARPVGVLDYSLFEGLACIPRFSLSSGCSFRCAFCTVPDKLVLASPHSLRQEAAALAGLEYALVFMDDKSFGDAPNWSLLGRVGDWLRADNEAFEGFIIQTPPSLAAKPGFLDACRDMGVRYVEFGVETVNDPLLRYLRKPFRVRHLMKACEAARRLGLYVIPNFIIGIPGDDYVSTLAWLRDNVDIVPVMNVNWLALHYGNVRGDLGLPMKEVEDRDQNSSRKTWLSPLEERRGWEAIDEMYYITDQYWTARSTYP